MNAADSFSPTRRYVLTGTIAMLASCMLESQARSGTVVAAHYQNDPRRPFADRLADLVIPESDTPGASKAGVADFVLLACDRSLQPLQPAVYERVRSALDNAATGSFLQLPRERQFSLLAEFDQRTYAAAATPGSPESAWRSFKTGIIAGYYTSEIGASKELVYDAVPGSRENFTLTDDFRMPSNLTIAGSL